MKHLGTVFGLTALSRILGFLRDLVMAATLGAGPLADAFMLAFRLPNHFRAILAEGAFNAAFLPTYAATQSRDGRDAAARLQETVLFWLLGVNLLVLGFVLVAPELFLGAMAPGFADEADRMVLVVALTRITFPYLLCMSLVAFLSALLNASERFVASSAAPILLNLAMIGGLLCAHLFPTVAHAAAWSVLAAGLAQVLLLVGAAVRAGLKVRLNWPKRTGPSAEFFHRLGPAVATSGALQIAVLADTIIATYLPTGSLSSLYYADRLYQLPIGLIGISVGTLLLPAIARSAGVGDHKAMREAANRAVRICALLGLPLMVLFVVFGDWIMALLFVRGAFDADAGMASARVLAAYSLGLMPALVLRSVVACFHGRGDMRAPLFALIGASVVNIALKLSLIGPFETAGLAGATAAGLWIYVGALYVVARRRGYLSVSVREIAFLVLAYLIAGAALMLMRDRFLELGKAVGGPLPFAVALCLPVLMLLGLAALQIWWGRVRRLQSGCDPE